MAKFNLVHEDIVFLRGAQEEMLSKLLQLQIAPNPIEILDWIFSHGVDRIVYSYNFDPNEFKKVATQGTIQINKLTSKLNQGNSGGPIFSDQGDIIGVAVGKIDKAYLLENQGTIPEDVNFAITLKLVNYVNF